MRHLIVVQRIFPSANVKFKEFPFLKVSSGVFVCTLISLKFVMCWWKAAAFELMFVVWCLWDERKKNVSNEIYCFQTNFSVLNEITALKWTRKENKNKIVYKIESQWSDKNLIIQNYYVWLELITNLERWKCIGIEIVQRLRR